ncbi:MAG: hypothetical protein D3913_13260 [Candidatus Electrothrix sp. LOE1_4_5]|nr:hypothetical protein [Candidatus Electrothrix gigas]
MEILEKNTLQGVLCLILLAISSIAQANVTCDPWQCVENGTIVNIGVLSNPGPHKICVDTSPPAPDVSGTLVSPGKLKRSCKDCDHGDAASPVMPPDCIEYNESSFDSATNKYVTDPDLPDTFKKAGEYSYKVSLISLFDTCSDLGPEYVGDFNVIVGKKCKDYPEYGEVSGKIETDISGIANGFFGQISATARAIPYIEVSDEEVTATLSGELKNGCCEDNACVKPTALIGTASVNGSVKFTATFSAFPQPPSYHEKLGSYVVFFYPSYGPQVEVTPSVSCGGSYIVTYSEDCAKECLELSASGSIDITGKIHATVEAGIYKKTSLVYKKIAELTAQNEIALNTNFSISSINGKFYDCADGLNNQPKICGGGLILINTIVFKVKVWIIEVGYTYSEKLTLIKPGCL